MYLYVLSLCMCVGVCVCKVSYKSKPLFEGV